MQTSEHLTCMRNYQNDTFHVLWLLCGGTLSWPKETRLGQTQEGWKKEERGFSFPVPYVVWKNTSGQEDACRQVQALPHGFSFYQSGISTSSPNQSWIREVEPFISSVHSLLLQIMQMDWLPPRIFKPLYHNTEYPGGSGQESSVHLPCMPWCR